MIRSFNKEDQWMPTRASAQSAFSFFSSFPFLFSSFSFSQQNFTHDPMNLQEAICHDGAQEQILC